MFPKRFPRDTETNSRQQGYSEIAYIVCTAAIPANAERPTNDQDAPSDHRSLERLKSAEQQFRQASILTILDTEKLELFTFYKKVDIVKDQKTILTKFGHVCKQNHCIIAYKNACRVIELLKSDNARIFRLFAAAILCSIQLQATAGKRAIKVNQEIWLLQSSEPISGEWSPTTRNCAHWRLEKVDLQIVASGQLLLAIRPALWPPLLSVADLIDPDVWPLDQSRGVTLYLLPTGQLARYFGVWVTGTRFTWNTNNSKSDAKVEAHDQQLRWIEKATAWLETNSSFSINSGTVWLEAEIPVLPKDEEDARSQILAWKRIYWPAALSFAFEQSTKSAFTEEPDRSDPLTAALEWMSSGAAVAQNSKSTDHGSLNPAFDSDENRLFDDDMQFGSPQNFMSVPMQTFAQSQMIYPTPPEGLNTQPTPGMSVDGTVQTPATVNQIMNANINSSPFAVASHETQAPATSQAIANFLEHEADENDDLFEEMDDDKLRHGSFDHEPNWDFFNSESLSTESKNGTTEREVQRREDTSDERQDTLSSRDEHDTYSPRASPKQMQQVDEVVEDQHNTHRVEAEIEASEPATVLPEVVADTNTDPFVVDVEETSEQLPQEITDAPSSKRRRSSAYEIVLPKETQRDLKYSKDGKYWFEPRRPYLAKTKTLPPVPAYRPASPGSDTSDSSDESINHGTPHQAPSNAHPWIEYTPSVAVQEPEVARKEDSNVEELDTDIEALIAVIASATGREPFTSPMPVPGSTKAVTDTDSTESSLSLQTLADQIASSSLLRNHPGLAFPPNCHSSTTDVSVDSTGSNVALPGVSLSELTSLPSQSSSSKTARLHNLPHGKVCVQQADAEIAADISILNFWETLNLQPLSGPKKIQALCMHPQSDAFAKGAGLFLQRMSETWVSCNLGDHQIAVLKDLTTDGLIAFDMDTDLVQLCQDVGLALAKAESELCTVLYLVIPRDDLSECLHLCHCFQELFQVMGENRTFDSGDIVLQLIATSLLVGTDTIAVPSEDQLMILALELYQRVPQAVPLDDSFLAPAMTLNEPLSYGPLFELNSNSASPLARYGQSCHFAYCVSVDNRWLVASWSDGLGNMATSVVYRLLDDEGALVHSRVEIFQHICQISLTMMNRQRQRWWLTIAKVGFFEVDELQDWSVATTQLAKDQKLLSRIALINIEMQPRMILRNTGAAIKPVPLATQLQNTLNTPVTTPQAANTTSPEQATPMTPTSAPNIGFNAPTPPEYNFELSNEADVYVTDVMEDCWIITLPFGLNQSHDFLEVRPALASGFLAKRVSGQTASDSTLSLLGVNLIAVPRKATTSASLTPAEREQVLEEILIHYRGLHILSLAKRIVDAQDAPIPCHIAVAYRTAAFLQQFA